MQSPQLHSWGWGLGTRTVQTVPGRSRALSWLWNPWCEKVGIRSLSIFTWNSTIDYFNMIKGILRVTKYNSVQFSRSAVSDSLWPHRLQHARLPCPSPIPRAYSNSCALSQWWHPTILSSVVPFSSCLQFFPASGSFPMCQFFASGSQSFGVSASAYFQWIVRMDFL